MKLFIKNNIKFIIVIVICLIGSSITTLATNYIFNSNEVSYDNTESGLHADEVQGAIDEVFQHATDYSDIKTKIGTGSLTTTSNTLIGGVNELNGKLMSYFGSAGAVDLNTVTVCFKEINGWGNSTINKPTGLAKGWYLLITIWDEVNEIGDITKNRTQVLIAHTGAVYRRRYESGEFTEWATAD